MFRFFIRRLLISIPVLLVGTLVAYLAVGSGIPGPIADAQMNPHITPQVLAEMKHEAGLDKPLLLRYWDWLTDFLGGNWGTSLAKGHADVQSTVLAALWNTSRLVVGAEILALILGAAIGVFAAVRQYSFFDYVATGVAFLFYSMPLFCVAIILENAGISFNQGLEDVGGGKWITLNGPPAGGFTGSFGDQIVQYTGAYILPTLTLMVISFASYSRFQRASMLETIGSDFVRTARAKGLSSGRVIVRHGMRNALIPVVTLFTLNFGQTFGGAIITEVVFNWQGMGVLLVKSVEQFDPTMLMGWLFVTGMLVIVFNLIADVLVSYLDPRIRLA